MNSFHSPKTKRSASWQAVALSALLLFGASSAMASETPERSAGQGFVGLAAVTCTVAYAPIKVFIAGSGFIVGASAWMVTLGSHEPAFTILERTSGGDWVVTPEHIRGDRQFSMLGPNPILRRNASLTSR